MNWFETAQLIRANSPEAYAGYVVYKKRENPKRSWLECFEEMAQQENLDEPTRARVKSIIEQQWGAMEG